MPGKPIPLVYNPAAGRGRGARRMERLAAEFERTGIAFEPVASAAPGDVEAKVLAACDAGHERIIMAGGDGSVHEAVNGLMQAPSPAALGVIPTGTGNDFAKACAIPLHLEAAAALLADRLISGTPPRAIDVGCMNGRYFANGAGIGFDAKISAIARSIRWPLGNLVYLLAVVRGLVSGVTTPRMRIECNGTVIDGELTLANISNGPWVGGLFEIAPMALNDDGLLDLVHADAFTRRRILRLLPKLLDGRHIGEAGVHHATVSTVRVRADAPLPAHLDGEVLAPQTEFDIRVLPGALQLL
ncbi:MAG: diacylglycerol kinase family protein [Woeseiaceae bacterium]|nr:diacylglycerol kinase family protein [Woeseiaceae bacterium]